jgi:hypothetical protein
VRDELGVHPRSLQILREAMLADVKAAKARARPPPWTVCRFAARPARRRCRTNANRLIGHNYWFASFAPYENPKYAVVVMVAIAKRPSVPAGSICAPIAHDIYEEILKKENALAAPRILAAAN